jgi:hypothetical protein
MENLMMAVMTALLLGVLFKPPKSLSLRGQFVAAASLFSIAWGGIVLALALRGTALFQSEAVAAVWMAAFGTAAALLGPIYFVPALFGLLRRLRRKRVRREKWSSFR